VKNRERRKFTRIPFEAFAQLLCPAGAFDSEIIDISLKGVLLRRPENLSLNPGDPVQVVIHAVNDAFTISISTTLEHLEQDALGLAFTEIDIDSATHLRRLVELNLGDDVLLNRELAELANPGLRRDPE